MLEPSGVDLLARVAIKISGTVVGVGTGATPSVVIVTLTPGETNVAETIF
jgi:ribose 5-phosphate isomerase